MIDELQQSALYARYIKQLHWEVDTVDGQYVYIKKFPLFGSIAKIQRVTKLPDKNALRKIVRKHNIRSLAIEPDTHVSQKQLSKFCKTVGSFVKINKEPFLPTKTIIVDVTEKKELLFKRMSEAKRRAVRRAIKNGIEVRESSDLSIFLKLKSQAAGPLGWLTTIHVKPMWELYHPKHATILLAYSPEAGSLPVGGIFLLFWKRTAYYWIAGATKEGKKLFAPTLLVWEALILAKSRGSSIFDFVGIWDERIPRYYKEWRGFTKFKEGFGGNEVVYPICNYTPA